MMKINLLRPVSKYHSDKMDEHDILRGGALCDMFNAIAEEFYGIGILSWFRTGYHEIVYDHHRKMLARVHASGV